MSIRIVLFEDDPGSREKILEALNDALTGKGEALLFAPSGQQNLEGVYQDRIETDLSAETYKDATLILADYDLSLSPKYRGLSEQQVRAAATRLAIPECGYARGETGSSVDFVRLSKQQEASIGLDFKPGQEQHLAEQAVSIAVGFAFIAERMPRTLNELGGRTTPGALMAHILNHPEYADKIALYASGDQDRLVSIKKKDKDEEDALYHRRLSCALGYWLWDSILRYPGVLVNLVAAASYLNIHEEDFKQHDIQEPFTDAQYGGPFAEAERPQWWRGKLDDIVAGSGLSDGRELAVKKLNRQVRRSECSVDPEVSAGYYCMLSKQPVSLKNSDTGPPWFPRGADLARVIPEKWQEIGPWL